MAEAIVTPAERATATVTAASVPRDVPLAVPADRVGYGRGAYGAGPYGG